MSTQRLQAINDEIARLLDEWYDHDQHFDSERLHQVNRLREERSLLLMQASQSDREYDNHIFI